jgi:hypothetical protein
MNKSTKEESSSLVRAGIAKNVAATFHKEFGIKHNTTINAVKTKQEAVKNIINHHLVIWRTECNEFGGMGYAVVRNSRRGGGYEFLKVDNKGSRRSGYNWTKKDVTIDVPAGAEYWTIDSYQPSYVNPKNKSTQDKLHYAREAAKQEIRTFIKKSVHNALSVRAKDQYAKARAVVMKLMDKAEGDSLRYIARNTLSYTSDEALSISQAIRKMAAAKDMISASTGKWSDMIMELTSALHKVYPKETENYSRVSFGGGVGDDLIGQIITLSMPRWADEEFEAVDTPKNIVRKMVAQMIRDIESK